MSTSSALEALEDLPGHSLLAIQRRRKESGLELEAAAYLYDEQLFIVTSVMSVPGSAHVEIGESSVLSVDASDSELGHLVCDHLLRHRHEDPGNLSQLKRSDWPAYRASGSKAITHFEANSWRADVATLNLVLEIEVGPLRSLQPEISVRAVANPVHAEVGATLRKSLEAGRALRAAGLI